MPGKDKPPPPPQPLRTFLNLRADPDPSFAYDPKKPKMRPYVPTKGQLRAQAGLMGLADLVRGLTIGASDEKDSNAAQIGELIQTGIPFLKSLGLAGAAIQGGLKIVGSGDDVARGLYSRVDEALKLIPAKGAHPNKVASLLKSNASAEELAYRKVPEFLAAKGNATVTPAELAAHLAAHPAPMPVVRTLGAPTPSNEAQAHLGTATDALKAYLVEQRAFSPSAVNDYILDVARNELSPAQIRAAQSDPEQWRLMTDVFDRYKHRGTIPEPPTPTKYGSYQVPGGENYRETLSTLPDDTAAMEARIKELDNVISYGDEVDRQTMNEVYAERERLQHNLRSGAGTFRSGHFDEPNILVHTRSNERTLPTGEPGRFVEEVQSDWHQKGKQQGYQLPPAQEAELRAQYNALAAEKDTLAQQRDPRTNQMLDEPRWHALSREQDAIMAQVRGGVPDAPFKEAWPDLGLKQQVLEAANDPNAQWIGHTSGQTQAARYDLSKQIDSLQWVNWPAAGKDHGLLVAFKDGQQVIKETIPQSKLADYIGKEAAERLLTTQSHPLTGARELSGVDLQVGGEGMRHFYDNLLPKRLEKILKPFGGKVERVRLGARSKGMIDAEMDALHEAGLSDEAFHVQFNRLQHERGSAVDDPAWIARLSPEMKARIRREGLPLLSLLGAGYLWQAPNEQPEYRQ